MLKPNGCATEENWTSGFDPVDVVTGEFYLHRTDFSLPGLVPIEWRTYYSSLADADSPLGRRWFFMSFCEFRGHRPDGENR